MTNIKYICVASKQGFTGGVHAIDLPPLHGPHIRKSPYVIKEALLYAHTYMCGFMNGVFVYVLYIIDIAKQVGRSKVVASSQAMSFSRHLVGKKDKEQKDSDPFLFLL